MVVLDKQARIKSTLHSSLRILDIQRDNYRTMTFVLDGRVDAQPGQFVMLWLPGFDEKPFSLVDNDPITLMITAVGPTTEYFHELAVGEKLWVRGPFGRGYDVGRHVRHALLVGGGYGVAPLLFLARKSAGTVEKISVTIGAQSKPSLLYVDRFQALAEQTSTNVHVHLATDDGSAGQRGFVTEPTQLILSQGDVDCLYACGPDLMLAALKLLAEKNHTPCQLSWEAYMRCGMGLCGSCEHEGQLLCMDGPVLSY